VEGTGAVLSVGPEVEVIDLAPDMTVAEAAAILAGLLGEA
jgi:hypothetical protein